MKNRSYKEKIVLIGSLVGVACFLPFTIYRYLTEDYLLAFLESCLAAAILSIFIYVWRTHKVVFANVLLCVLFLSVVVAVIHIKGPSLVYWAYPVLVGTFCLVNQRTATVLSLLTSVMLLPALYPVLSTQEFMVIYASLILTSLVSYVYTIASKNHQSQLSQLASKDALTGAFNRRSLDESLSVAVNQKQQSPNTHVSLLLLDLDHFKQINDNYGHKVGDQILSGIADLIRSSVRFSDRLYRYGGEEFVVITEGVDADGAVQIAENIRHRVEKSHLLGEHKVTISIGVSELTLDCASINWLNQADQALYEAKRHGRNQVRPFCKNKKLAVAA